MGNGLDWLFFVSGISDGVHYSTSSIIAGHNPEGDMTRNIQMARMSGELFFLTFIFFIEFSLEICVLFNFNFPSMRTKSASSSQKIPPN